ncbi:MAG: PTS sugar transporter subunit IIA [Desulfarculus sp.]|jgi:PTS system nitrogen regulatory IIA component|nr:MAG: PTS sugar transporter subunit IIA [Desulfarculus sp.]
MKLTDILGQEQVIADLQGRGKRAVMEELCRPLLQAHPELDPAKLMEVLVERERLGSTGIGDGIAIPHGKLGGLSELLLTFGRSVAGVDFDSLDGKPAHLFFLVVAPDNSAGVHLKALARISRLLKSNTLRQQLMAAGDAHDLYEIIQSQDEEF